MSPRLLVAILLLAVVLVLALVVSDIPTTEVPVKEKPVAARVVYAPVTSTTTSVPAPTSTVPATARTAPTSKRPLNSSGAMTDVIRAGFARFGAVVAEQAVRVSSCETGGTFNPRATNGPNTGLFQLNGQFHRARAASLGFTWAQMFDPAPNVAVAANLYAEQGWKPWACRWAA